MIHQTLVHLPGGILDREEVQLYLAVMKSFRDMAPYVENTWERVGRSTEQNG
jgi:hypothetical protein